MAHGPPIVIETLAELVAQLAAANRLKRRSTVLTPDAARGLQTVNSDLSQIIHERAAMPHQPYDWDGEAAKIARLRALRLAPATKQHPRHIGSSPPRA
jgi:hypothetical protein